MKTVLIVLFIILFTYLIAYMCGRSTERGSNKTVYGEFEKSMLVLDHLRYLDDSDLYRLRDDIYALKSILDGQSEHPEGSRSPYSFGADQRRSLSGKEALSRIQKEMKNTEFQNVKRRKPSFSIMRIALIQIALLVIIMMLVFL